MRADHRGSFDRSERLLAWLGGLALLIGALNALRRFPTAYNFLVIHLPAALAASGGTTFTPPQFVADILAGHPPLAHLALGLLIAVTGSAAATALLGLLGLLALVGGVRWLTGEWVPARRLLLASLAVPLVAVDLYVPYLDLWTGAWLGLALYTVLHSVRTGPTPRTAGLFVAAATCAAWSDYHAWGFTAVLWLWCAGQWGWPAFIRRRGSRRLVALTLGLSALLLLAWPVRNLHRYGNLTHPWPKLPVSAPAWLLAPTAATAPVFPAESQMPDLLRPVPQPLRFLASVFETGRWWSPWIVYSCDMWDDAEAMPLVQAPDFRSHNANHRVGGWGLWTVLLVLAWWVHWWRSGDPLARRAAGLFALLLLALAPLPDSHELRFSLALPLGALACLVTFDPTFLRARPGAILLCLGLTLAHVARQVAAPGAASVAAAAPPVAREFWAHARRDTVYALPASATPVFWAGPDFRSFQVRPDGQVSPTAR